MKRADTIATTDRTAFALALLWIVACDSQGKWRDAPPDARPESLGVVECDEYVTAFKSCLARVPADGRTAFENAGNAQIAGFKKTAQDPTTREVARNACSRALGALKRNPACK